MSTGVYFADSVPLPYLFGKQTQQSLHRSLAVSRSAALAMLGIGESGAVNVTILVARQPFLQYLAGLFQQRLNPLAAFHNSFTSVGNRRWLS